MFGRGSFFVRLVVSLLMIAILIGGGALLYRAGFTQGYIQGAAASTSGATQSGPGLSNQPVPFYPGYWPWWAYPHFGFFPFAGFLGFFLFIFLFFGLMRLLFRPHHWGPMGGYPRHWHGWGAPPWTQGSKPGDQTGEGQRTPENQPKEAG